ncbi:MAG: hypothetical protein ACOCYQ_02975, partial [Alkalispirochaeta sp.]
MESLIKKVRKSSPVPTRSFFLLTILLLSVVVFVPASGNTETGTENSGSESSVPSRDDNPRIASTPRGAAAVAAATGIDEGEFS